MWIFILSAVVCFAADSPAVTRARQELEQLRPKVVAGLVPAARLAEAQEAVDDAVDTAVLDRTLYGHIEIEKLSPAEAEEMINAASRRVARAQNKLVHDRSLIAQGLAPAHFSDESQAEVDSREQALAQSRDRASLINDITAMAKSEAAPTPDAEGIWQPQEYVEGDHLLDAGDIRAITLAFEKQFHEPLPVSARGMTEVHRALGFDHTGRIDVAVAPDSPEGLWLRQFLASKSIPYFAFRIAIPGKATGAHIHIGPGSTRLHVSD